LIYASIVNLLFSTRLDQAGRHNAVTSTHVTLPKEARKVRYFESAKI